MWECRGYGLSGVSLVLLDVATDSLSPTRVWFLSVAADSGAYFAYELGRKHCCLRACAATLLQFVANWPFWALVAVVAVVTYH